MICNSLSQSAKMPEFVLFALTQSHTFYIDVKTIFKNCKLDFMCLDDPSVCKKILLPLVKFALQTFFPPLI